MLRDNWREDILVELVQDKVSEDLHLEYKNCAALQVTAGTTKDHPIVELSKDVSAFANADGGSIIYGVPEDKQNRHHPYGLDTGYDPLDLRKERLEQWITGNVQPRIEGLRVIPVPLNSSSPGRVAYVVSIPQARSRAPHQAKDKRYYKRRKFESCPMEDYEVRVYVLRVADGILRLHKLHAGVLPRPPYSAET